MKGIFIVYGQSSNHDHTGVGLKVRNQIECFNNAGLNCKEHVLPIKKDKLLSIKYRLPFFNVYPVWKKRKDYLGVDYIYMRRPFVMNIHMRRIFKYIKK